MLVGRQFSTRFFRHCERSEAIQGGERGFGLLRYTRNDEDFKLWKFGNTRKA
jgi:hypothetical protein